MPSMLYAVPGALSKTALGQAELRRRGELLNRWAAPDTTVAIRDVPAGPATIESAYEEYLSIPPTAALLQDAERDGVDAAILGCFGDPGLDALREITTTMPVVGPGETSFHLAASLGDRFGVVTVTDGVLVPLRHLVARAGLSGKLAGIAVTGVPVLEVTADPARALSQVAAHARRLIDDHGADTIVLGCMSMAFLDVTAELESKLGIPVINPARAALHTAELLARAGLRHSKKAFPTPAKLADPQTDLASLLVS